MELNSAAAQLEARDQEAAKPQLSRQIMDHGFFLPLIDKNHDVASENHNVGPDVEFNRREIPKYPTKLRSLPPSD